MLEDQIRAATQYKIVSCYLEPHFEWSSTFIVPVQRRLVQPHSAGNVEDENCLTRVSNAPHLCAMFMVDRH
jgi:hypothetical protein